MSEKKVKHEEVFADWKDTDELIDGFVKAVGKFGLSVYEHPATEGSDTYGFIISNKKLSKKDLKIRKAAQ